MNHFLTCMNFKHLVDNAIIRIIQMPKEIWKWPKHTNKWEWHQSQHYIKEAIEKVDICEGKTLNPTTINETRVFKVI